MTDEFLIDARIYRVLHELTPAVYSFCTSSPHEVGDSITITLMLDGETFTRECVVTKVGCNQIEVTARGEWERQP